MPRAVRAPKLPPIEYWVEPIDREHVALHACRRWPGWPWLTVWAVMPIEECRRGYARTRRAAELLTVAEQKVNARWYRYAQRSLVRWIIQQEGRGDPHECWPVQQFYEAIKLPPLPVSDR